MKKNLILVFLFVLFNNQSYGSTSTAANATETKRRNPLKDIARYAKYYIWDGWYFLTSPTRLNYKNTTKLGGILLSTGIIYFYDEEIMKVIDRNRGNHTYKEMMKIGNEIEPYGLAKTMNPYYVGSAVLGYVFKIKKLETASVQLHETLFLGALFRKAAVHLTGRARPYEKKGAYVYQFNTGTSFFSGHTANAFELATILSHHLDFWPMAVTCYTFASLIGLQRLHASSHWPSDVFLGAVYGIVIAKSVIKLHEKRNVRVSFKIVPGWSGMICNYHF
jgi:membrane-associated phospholipid phosphatase